MNATLKGLGHIGTVLIAAACSSASGGSAIPHGSGGSGSGSGGSGNSGGFGATGSGGTGTGGFGAIGNSGGTGAVDQDAACTSVPQETKGGFQPADIIWIIDTSGSMTEEVPSVQNNMNAFSQQISQSGIDVHVILLAAYPNFINLNHGICINPPLGKQGGCPSTGAGSDNNLPKFFHDPVPPVGVQSNDGLDILVSHYNTYKPLLRVGATHWVVAVTDDDENGTYGGPGGGDAFIAKYKSLAPLSDFKMSGITSKSMCANAAAVGTVWQDIITKTNGINADICACAPGQAAACSQVFQGIFQQLANAIVQAAKPLDCQWPIPNPPAGQTLSTDKVNLEFTDSTGTTTQVYHVADQSACDPQQGGWYYDNDANPSQVISCPASCQVFKSATNAKINVLFGCQTQELPH